MRGVENRLDPKAGQAGNLLLENCLRKRLGEQFPVEGTDRKPQAWDWVHHNFPVGWVCEGGASNDLSGLLFPKYFTRTPLRASKTALARLFTPSTLPFIPSAPTRRAPSLNHFPSATSHATSTYASSSPPSGQVSVLRSSLSVKSSGPNTGSGIRSAREQMPFVGIERDKVRGQ
jgi:hypothetical protein